MAEMTKHSQSDVSIDMADLEKAHVNQSSVSDIICHHAPDAACSQLAEHQSVSVNSRKRSSQYSIFWSIYRQLFSVVFTVNIVFCVLLLVTDRGIAHVADAAAANFLACGLARQPMIVNIFFITLCSIPKSSPLWLRRTAANIYHYGGVHSGCGIASLLWYLALVSLMTRQFYFAPTHSASSIVAISVSYLIAVLLFLIIAVAYPSFRIRHHNAFEFVHRYCTWAVVALFLVLLLAFSKNASSSLSQSQGHYLIRLPAFWCVCISALAIIQPWTRLRQIPVSAEVLSPHALRLHLPGHTRFGKVISLAQHPGRDWHSFATFPDPAYQQEQGLPSSTFSVIVSNAGDWTGSLIANPPQYIYTRGNKTYGFTHVMRLFSRIVLVATGSGIGPCLAFLEEQKKRPALRLLWQTRAPLCTYGPKILKMVHQLDPDSMIVNSDKYKGRVDLTPLIASIYHETQAEMVCIISNQSHTQSLVSRLRQQGIAAMGPLFDS